jgi:hypothetical protein
MIVQPPLVEAVGQRAATIRHSIGHAPEFTPERLVALGRELPPKWTMTYDAAGRALQFDQSNVLECMDTSACSLRLYHLEHLPSFAAIIRRCYDESQAHEAAAREGGSTAESSIVFIGSAGAATRLHLDHHHNLLLQISGQKVLTIAGFDEPGRQLREVHRGFAAGGACTSTPTQTDTYRMGPGDGIYLPPYTFHSAEVLDGELSVALSCAFSTPATERAFRVHRANVALRHLGLRPAPPGMSAAADARKDWLGRGLQLVRPARL